jgi:hypothetical protein
MLRDPGPHTAAALDVLHGAAQPLGARLQSKVSVTIVASGPSGMSSQIHRWWRPSPTACRVLARSSAGGAAWLGRLVSGRASGEHRG